MKADPKGHKRFLLVDLLHPAQIKSYMGKTNKSLRDQFDKFLLKESTMNFEEVEEEDRRRR